MNGDPWPVCVQQLTDCGFTPICPAEHCTDFQETPLYHKSCAGARQYAPVQTLGCFNSVTQQWQFPAGSTGVLALCKQLAQQDPNWDSASCYCCCSCFARDTPIALADGEHKAIGDVLVGEQILVGSLSGTDVRWSPAPVTFSGGTSDGGHEPAMVYIVFGDDNRALIASPDQPFMLNDGTIVTANRLVPGQQLRGVDGSAVALKTASIGTYTGGVHHVAADQQWTGSIDGHLIGANGVVVGDYTLQLHLPAITDRDAVADLDALPVIGTAAYVEANPDVTLAGETHVYGEMPAPTPLFAPHAAGDMAIPYGAVSWLTEAQAQDVQDKGNPRPVVNRAGYNAAVTASKLLRALYPDIVFYVDWPRTEPNVWAFQQFGEKFVVMGGGLPRTPGFQYEGAVMAFAAGAARFLAGAPQKSGGLSCTGQADLYAFGVMSQTVWFGAPWTMEVTKAFDQISTIFGLVSAENAAGNPLDVCDDPSLECRLTTMQNALSGGTLPECAGGPKPPVLALQSAVGTSTGVTLTFSQALTAETAQAIGNYTLSPEATITSATLDPAKGFIVVLDAELKPGTYEISCTGLESIYGVALQPDPAKTSFAVAA